MVDHDRVPDVIHDPFEERVDRGVRGEGEVHDRRAGERFFRCRERLATRGHDRTGLVGGAVPRAHAFPTLERREREPLADQPRPQIRANHPS